MHNEAHLAAFYKDDNAILRKISTVIGMDPEGVTEEDVQRMQHEVYVHLSAQQVTFREPVLVLVRGGKA